MDRALKDALFHTPIMTVLYAILHHPEQELTDPEITTICTSVKKSAVNLALRKLSELGLLERRLRGKTAFNRLIESPLSIQLKIIANLVHIQNLIDEFKPLCSKIILFGSRASGTNTSESDFDLFAISSKPDSVNKAVRKSPLSEIIQILIRKPEQMLTFKKDEPTLSKEISKGMVLWEKI